MSELEVWGNTAATAVSTTEVKMCKERLDAAVKQLLNE
jgi:hypothetical protein